MGLLERVRIRRPCPVEWDDMEGDDRVRHCGRCSLNVYNVAEMTRAEAEALVMTLEGRLCLRLHWRPDGTVITRDCPVESGEARRRLLTLAGVMSVVLLAVYTFAPWIKVHESWRRLAYSQSHRKIEGRYVDTMSASGDAELAILSDGSGVSNRDDEFR